MRLAVEDQLLLACARAELDDSEKSRVASLAAASLDWAAVLEASIVHAVAPLLLHGLEQSAALAPVPAEVVAELRSLTERSGARNRRLISALGGVVRALDVAAVPVLGLKDVGLLFDVYPDPALRPMGDVDLLVPREAFPRAVEELGRLGFAAVAGESGRFARTYGSGVTFSRDVDDVWIDLQWNILEREWDRYGESPYGFDAGPLWSRARRADLGDCVLLVPSLEDLLYHLCAHLEGHAYGELILFSDIVELLRRHAAQFDWALFVDTVHSVDGEAPVHAVLGLVERLFGVPLPEGVLGSLRPAYRRTALTEPLYANLNALHLGLDQLEAAAVPGPDLLRSLERVTRRQAARAMAVETELDGLAKAFLHEGGVVAVYRGEPSPRTLPSAELPAFGQLELLVRREDTAALMKALSARGFARTESGAFVRSLGHPSGDPAISGREGTLELAVELADDVGGALRGPAGGDGNRATALRSLRTSIGGSPLADTHADCRLTVLTLDLAEILASLAVGVGRREQERILALVELLDTFERVSPPVDWSRVMDVAREHGCAESCRTGLDLLYVAGGPEVPGIPAGPPPRLFEWARYGAADRDAPELRRAYFVASAFLGQPGAKKKLAYAGRSVFGAPGSPAVVPRLLVDLASLARRRRRTTPLDLAYWAQPAPAAE